MNRAQKFEYIKNKIPFKWFDFIVLGVVGLIILLVFLLVPFSKGEQVNVFVDGELKYTYSLNEDIEIKVEADGGVNTIRILDKKVSVIFSNCSNQNCVRQGEIFRGGERIVCLPHKLVVEITGGEIDAVS